MLSLICSLLLSCWPPMVSALRPMVTIRIPVIHIININISGIIIIIVISIIIISMIIIVIIIISSSSSSAGADGAEELRHHEEKGLHHVHLSLIIHVCSVVLLLLCFLVDVCY